MSGVCDYFGGMGTYQKAFECFEERFLKGKKSIFDLRVDTKIYTTENIQYLIDNFIENGCGGDASFIQKIKYQLIDNPISNNPTDELKKGAIEILATVVWLWRMAPANSTKQGRISSVEEILNLIENSINLNRNPFLNDIKGFASTGTYYNTNKPFELAFIIKFLQEYLEKSDDPTKILSNLNLNKSVKITTKGELSKNGNFSIINEDDVPKTASIYNALLYLFAPDNYEPILSKTYKKNIIDAFSDLLRPEDESKDDNEKITAIREKLKAEGKWDENERFYKSDLLEIWNPTVLPAKNVIYYGAPGTGKTYELLEMVKRKAKAQDTDNPSKYYKVVQFHPSYNYEDFIDGIKPTKTTGNSSLQLELVNGIFKEMCIEAFKELQDNKDDPKQFYFVADEINRAELSRVFGELLLCLEEDKRLRYEGDTLKGELIKTQNSSLWEDKHAVAKIDNELYFGIPENIYFLGTMNDIDRSIDSFDLALRRRFKWIHKGCNYDVVTEYLLAQGINDDTLSEYLDEKKGRCVLLNKYINETLNLGKSYELGHTYFMRIKVHGQKISKSAYERLFDFEIAPLVTEYLRAEYPSGNELEKKVKEMRGLFVDGNKI